MSSNGFDFFICILSKNYIISSINHINIIFLLKFLQIFIIICIQSFFFKFIKILWKNYFLNENLINI